MISRYVLIAFLAIPILLSAADNDPVPMQFFKDQEGNVVPGSWRHIEKAIERCRDQGTVLLAIMLYHKVHDGMVDELASIRDMKGAAHSKAFQDIAAKQRAHEHEYTRLQDEFIQSIEAMGIELEIVDRAKVSPYLAFRANAALIEILTTHPMVSSIFDTEQMNIRVNVQSSVNLIGADLLHVIKRRRYLG